MGSSNWSRNIRDFHAKIVIETRNYLKQTYSKENKKVHVEEIHKNLADNDNKIYSEYVQDVD
jgi:hypothetical protein